MIRRLIPWFLFVLGGITPGQVPEWELYDNPSERRDNRWFGEFNEWVTPLEEAKADSNPNHYHMDLKGLYALPPPNATGRCVRFHIHDGNPQKFRLLFETDGGEYRIELGGGNLSFLNGMRMDGEQPILLADDSGRWRAYGDGLLDIRYQDGKLVASRGKLPLLVLPIPSEPKKLTMEFAGRMNLLQFLSLPPVELTPNPFHLEPSSLLPASAYDWEKDVQYRFRAEPDPLRLTEGENGSVELAVDDGRDRRQADLFFQAGNPSIIMVKVDAATHGTGLIFPLVPEYAIYFAEENGKKVLCQDPFNKGHVETYQKRGFVYGAPFYIRMVYGLDFVYQDVSADGVHWVTFYRTHRSTKQTVGPQKISLVLLGREKDKKQSIRVGGLRIKSFPLLKDFVDPGAIFGQDPESPLWRMAANQALLTGWSPAEVKQAALADSLGWLIDSERPVPDVIRGLTETMPFLRPRAWGGNALSMSYDQLLLDLGERIRFEEAFEQAPAWLDLWYAYDFEVRRHSYLDQKYGPPTLIRARLYDLYHREQWPELRREAARYRFLVHPSRDNKFGTWMLTQAEARMDEPDESTGNQVWLHPLRIRSDRETENLLGELIAAMDEKEIERACRILIRGTVTDSLSVTVKDPDLYQPSIRVLKQVIEGSPEFQQTLLDEFGPTGLVRVNRAIQEQRYDELETIAIQFMGTPASRKALAVLADQDLSIGKFSDAAKRYRRVLPHAEGEERGLVQAKLNLSRAMLGLEPSGVVTNTVAMPGRSFTVEEYHALMKETRDARRGAGSDVLAAGAVEPTLAPGPKDGTVSWEKVLDLPFLGDLPLSTARFGSLLMLQQGGLIQAVDLKNASAAWSQGAWDPKKRTEAHPPLVYGNRLVAYLPVEKAASLQCFELPGFKPVWTKAMVDRPVGAALVLDGMLYQLAISPEEHLNLHRIQLVSGQADLPRLLLRHHRFAKGGESVRMVEVDDGLIIAAAGAFLGCDRDGQIQWIRRMDFVPQDVDRDLLVPNGRMAMTVKEGQVIGCGPAAAELVRLDAESGSLVWRRFMPQRRFILEARDDRMLVRSEASVEMVNLADGAKIWKTRSPGQNRLMSAAADSLLELRLDKAQKKKGLDAEVVRGLRWISSTDGSVLAEADFPETHPELYGVHAAVPHENKLFLVTSDAEVKKKTDPDARLVVVTF